MTNGTPDVESNELDFDWDIPHSEVFGALAGENRADNFKHGIARSAFLRRLGDDPRAEALWQKWGEWTGVNEAAMAVAKALEVLATAAEVDAWEELAGLFDDDPSDDSQAARQRLVENLDCKRTGDNVFQCDEVDAANDAIETFHKTMEQLDAGRLAEDAVNFVRVELKLPWPWLCIELLLQFYLGAWGWTFGWEFTHNWWVEDPPVTVPDSEWTFKTDQNSGETVESALERLTEEFLSQGQELVDHAEPQLLPVGRLPGDKRVKVIERNVGWFYESRLCGVSIRPLAREYFREFHPDRLSSPDDDRKTIRSGIEEAERLLGLTRFVLK